MEKFQVMESSAAPSASGNRVLIILTAVCAIIAVIAIIIAAVALSRPGPVSNITIQSQTSTKDGGTSAAQGSSGGSSAGSASSLSAISSPSRGRIFTIAVGHDWGAIEYIDTSGYLAGFHHDLIDAVCTEAGMDCRTVWDKYNNCWDSTPGQPSHGGTGLLGRWYDACSGWSPTIERIQTASFSSPYFKPPVSYLYVKKGTGATFPSRNLANKKIGFVDGWATNEKCLARWTDVQGQDSMTVVHLNNPADIVAQLNSGQIDAAFSSSLDEGEYGSQLDKVPGGGFSCMLAGAGMMTRKDNDFSSYWNVGFNKLLSSGKFKKLCSDAVVKHGSKGSILCVDS